MLNQLLPHATDLDRQSSNHSAQPHIVRRRDLPIMAEMSIMEERLRRIGQKWTGTTNGVGAEEPEEPSRIGSSINDTDLGRIIEPSDSRVSSISSLADVAMEMAFPTPPVRTAQTSSTLPATHRIERIALLGEPWPSTNQTCSERRPSTSSTMTVVSDQDSYLLVEKDNGMPRKDGGKSHGPSSPMPHSVSRETICLGSPPLLANHRALSRSDSPTRQNSISSISAMSTIIDAQNGWAREESPSNTPIISIPAERHQEQSLQPTTNRLNAAPDSEPQRATQKTHEWLVPPKEDIADWGELEIIGRSR